MSKTKKKPVIKEEKKEEEGMLMEGVLKTDKEFLVMIEGKIEKAFVGNDAFKEAVKHYKLIKHL